MSCSVPGCGRAIRGRGWCAVHYGRWRRYGDPLAAGGLQYVHRLSSVDPARRVAICASCGPVSLHRQGNGWKCAGRRRTNRSRHHGLTADQRRALIEAHDNRCDVCGASVLLRVDHDHRTGIIRGVLCQRCNAGISYFEDDPVRLARASDYLAASAVAGSAGSWHEQEHAAGIG